MASMTNIARIAKIAALLLFFLPWVTISCSTNAMSQMGGPGARPMSGMSGMTGSAEYPLATATGAQLAMGTVSVANPMGNPAAPAQPAGTGAGNPFEKPNMAVIGAALLILLSIAATFLLKGRIGALVAAAGSGLAALAIYYAVMIQIPAEVTASFLRNGPSGGPGAPSINPAEIAQLIQVRPQMGFWLTVAVLAAALVLNVLAMKGSSAAPAAAPPAPPPVS
ncbi:MAG TPA: hypothetical protein VIT38_08415 [Allosphingosinicella sp.]